MSILRMYNPWAVLLLIITSYLIGGISSSYIIGKKLSGKDIRTLGSGNAGATNALRSFGKKAAAAVLICDLFKGTVSTLIGYKFGGTDMAYICAFFAVLGHTFPVFLKFKGGKGVATSLGAAIALNGIFASAVVTIGLIIIIRTRKVSLGAITGEICFLLLTWINGVRGIPLIFTTMFVLLVVYNHRGNIKRLLDGTERRI